MSIKKTGSLILSFLLLINPLAGVLAEEIKNNTVDVTAPKNGEPVVNETVDGILIDGNTNQSILGAMVNADNKADNNDNVSATLTVEGDINVTQEGTGSAQGIVAMSNDAETSVTVEDVTAQAGGYASGMDAKSENEGSTQVQTGDITIESSGGGATGVSARSSDAETAVTVDGNVNVDGASNSNGVNAESDSKGTTEVTVEGNVDVDAGGSAKGIGAESESKGSTEVHTGDVSVSSSDSSATGIVASSSDSETTVTVENVTSQATGYANGVDAKSEKEGSTEVKTDDITATSSGSGATGVSARSSDAETTVTVEGNVTVNSADRANGVNAESESKGTTEVNTGDIKVTSSNKTENREAYAYGINASGSNTTVSAGNVEANGESKGTAHAAGVYSYDISYIGYSASTSEQDKNVNINTNNITANATSESSNATAYGVESRQRVDNSPVSSQSSPNLISDNTQTVSVYADGNIKATATSSGNKSSANARGISEEQQATSLLSGETVSQSADITATGDVSAVARGGSSSRAQGVYVSSNSYTYDNGIPDLTQKTVVTVKGNVSAEATSVNPSESNGVSTNAAGVQISASQTDVDVTVEKDVSAEANSVSGTSVNGILVNNNKDSEIDVIIGGNVSVSSNSSDIYRNSMATGITSQVNQNGVNTITVSGNVTATASGEATVPTYTNSENRGSGNASSGDLSGLSVVKIGGNVTATAESDSINGHATGVSVTAVGNQKAAATNNGTNTGTETAKDIEKQVNAIGVNSRGINSEVTVDGNVLAQVDAQDGFVYGVEVTSENDGNATVDIKGGIEVVGNFSDTDDLIAAGIFASVEGNGNVSVKVGDDVTATSDGIVTELKEGSSGEVDIFVDGDVTGTKEAAVVIQKAEDSEAVAKLIVDGTLSGGEAGILVEPTVTKDNVDLTVWKVDLTQVDGEEHAVVAGDGDGLKVTDDTKAIEQEIRYIIKLEANANGNVELEGTEKVDGYDTAKEGANVVMKISANAGYHVTAAYNGEGQQVPLLKDETGNYYVIVPRGGGVYLSAVIDPDAVDNGGDDGNDDSPAQQKATVVQQETQTLTGALTDLLTDASADTSADTGVSAEDAATISRYSAEQQVAIILTKLGMDDALKSSGIYIKDLALQAASGITSDLSSLMKIEELTIDGETAEWQVVEVIEDGMLVKYCFRQLEDGTWIYRKIIVKGAR